MSDSRRQGPPDRSQLLDLIVENSCDFAIFTIDADGAIVSWNAGARCVFGHGEDEAIGLSATSWVARMTDIHELREL